MSGSLSPRCPRGGGAEFFRPLPSAVAVHRSYDAGRRSTSHLPGRVANLKGTTRHGTWSRPQVGDAHNGKDFAPPAR